MKDYSFQRIIRLLYSLGSIIVMEIFISLKPWSRKYIGYSLISIPFIDIFVMFILYYQRKQIADGIIILLSILGSLWIPMTSMIYTRRYTNNIITLILTMRIIHCMIVIYFSSRRLHDSLHGINYKILHKGNVIEQDNRIIVLDEDFICFKNDDVDHTAMPQIYREYPVIIYDTSYDDIQVNIRVFEHNNSKLINHILYPFLQWVRNKPRFSICKGEKLSYYGTDEYGGSILSQIILDNDISVLDITEYINIYSLEKKNIYRSMSLVSKYLQRSICTTNIDIIDNWNILPIIIGGSLRMRRQDIHVYYDYYRPILMSYVRTCNRTSTSRILRIVGTCIPYVMPISARIILSTTHYSTVPTIYYDIIII